MMLEQLNIHVGEKWYDSTINSHPTQRLIQSGLLTCNLQHVGRVKNKKEYFCEFLWAKSTSPKMKKN